MTRPSGTPTRNYDGGNAGPLESEDSMTERKRELFARIDALTDATNSVIGLLSDFMRNIVGAVDKDGDTGDMGDRLHRAVKSCEDAVREMVCVTYCGVYTEEEMAQIVAFQESPFGRRMKAAEPAIKALVEAGLLSIVKPAIDRVIAETP